MKITNRLLGLLFTLFVLVACSADKDIFELPASNDNVMTTCKMRFEGGLNEYGEATRSGSYQWKDGDKLYIKFQNGDVNVNGYAIYSSESDEWNVSYAGSIASGVEAKCLVYYFADATPEGSFSVKLGATSAIYEALDATYILSSGELALNAILQPKCSRLRFVSAKEENIILMGIKCYSCFDLTKNNIEESYTLYALDSLISLKTKNNGSEHSTDYIYILPPLEEDSLYLFNKETENNIYIYVKQYPKELQTNISSGYMTIPSSKLNKGWYIKNNDFAYSFFAQEAFVNKPSNRIVDMGLSVKWACVNLPGNDENGDYYMWGDTYDCRKRSDDDYYSSSTLSIAGYASYDAATKLWGTNWRMPSQTEVNELYNNCYVKSGKMQGISGYYFVSKKNRNVLFLPAAGRYYYSSSWSLSSSGYMYYWTCNPYSSSGAYYFSHSNSSATLGKYYACPIRPVYVK